MKRIFLLFVVLLIPNIAYSFQDEVAMWSRMEISFQSGEKITISQDQLKLKSLTLSWDGKNIEVPAEELQDISFPHINTLFLSFSEFYVPDLIGVPYRVIHFRYGLEKDEAYGEFPEANFLFYKGQLQERKIRKKDSPTHWNHEVKRSGEPVKTNGTETVIR